MITGLSLCVHVKQHNSYTKEERISEGSLSSQGKKDPMLDLLVME